jgi:hypothetical protein
VAVAELALEIEAIEDDFEVLLLKILSLVRA